MRQCRRRQAATAFISVGPFSRFRLCFFYHLTRVRLWRGRSRRHNNTSNRCNFSLVSVLTVVVMVCFLVVLLVFCDTCSVCCCYSLVWQLELECTCYTAAVTIELSNTGVSCNPSSCSSAACGSFSTTREATSIYMELVAPWTLLLRAESGGPGLPRSKSDTYRRTSHDTPCSLFVSHPGIENRTFNK